MVVRIIKFTIIIHWSRIDARRVRGQTIARAAKASSQGAVVATAVLREPGRSAAVLQALCSRARQLRAACELGGDRQSWRQTVANRTQAQPENRK